MAQSVKPQPLRGVGMALLAAALWGTTGTAQSFAPLALSAYWVGALRLCVAAAFFAVLLLALRPSPRQLPWRGMALAGACVALYNLCFFAGLRATSVAVGTALAIGSGPVWAGILQAATTGRAPPALWWLGTLLAVAGGALMVFAGSPGGAGLAGSAWGIALCLLAGLSYAAYALLNKRLVGQASPALVNACVFGLGAALACPAALALAGPLALRASDWWLLLYLGLVATGLAYWLFSSALAHISGPTGVTLALAEPVTAFALAVLVVGERPSGWAFAGLGLVLAGLGAVVWAELKPTQA